MMGSVFAMQGFGQFGAAIIALIVTAGFKDSLETASSAATCSGVCSLASGAATILGKTPYEPMVFWFGLAGLLLGILIRVTAKPSGAA